MALSDFTVNGQLDPQTNTVIPNNTTTWADLTTWDSWTSWSGTPADPLVWFSDVVDLGTSTTFNLAIDCEANGVVSYSVMTSDTGLFAGEETQTDIDPGDTGISSFTGRFVLVVISVTAESGLNTISSVSIRANTRTIKLRINDLDTSTLSGTTSARVLELDRTIGGVVNWQITPKQITAYDLDVYVTNTPTSTHLVPQFISKTGLTFALVGVDNHARDGIVDMNIEVLPEQYMQGNNLRIR